MRTSTRDFSYIYLIGPEGGQGPFKVGRSARPESRAKQIQTAYPLPVAVYGSWPHTNPRAVEAEAHRLLAPWHISGEWFDVYLNRATAAILQAISHVDSDKRSEFIHYTLASMLDVIMPNAPPIPGSENDKYRIGYVRHISGLDVACQVGWLQAYGVLGPDMYIETDPKTNSTLKRAFREFRPGDRFLAASREVLGGVDQVQALLQIAEERHITIQFTDKVVRYTDDP